MEASSKRINANEETYTQLSLSIVENSIETSSPFRALHSNAREAFEKPIVIIKGWDLLCSLPP